MIGSNQLQPASETVIQFSIVPYVSPRLHSLRSTMLHAGLKQ